MSVERCPHLSQKGDIAACLFVVPRVLVVDVETVKPKVFEQPDGRRHELGAQGRIDDYGMEARRVGPAADREENLEVPIECKAPASVYACEKIRWDGVPVAELQEVELRARMSAILFCLSC